MRILFLTENFPPEVNAPASRTFEHAREWAKAGAQVTVITTAPNFPSGKVHAGYRNRWRTRETIAGIEVVRVWSFMAANEGFAARLVDFISFMVTGALAGLREPRPDVVVATSPQFFTAVAGWFVGALRRIPFVFEVRDLWPESIKAVGAMRDSWVLRLFERIELFLYRRAARVVVVTNAFRDDLTRRGIDPAKIDVVTNGVDLALFVGKPPAVAAALRQSLGLEGRFVATYIGTQGMAHRLDVLLEAAALLAADPAAPPVSLLLLGEGADGRRLRALAQARGLTNVVFLDPVPRAEVVTFWALSDCTIVHLRDTPLFRTVIPSKLFEAMAMGVPIVAGLTGESRGIVETSGSGLVVTPEDPTMLAASLDKLARDPALRARFAAQGKLAATGYDRKHLAARLLDILRRVAGSAKEAR